MYKFTTDKRYALKPFCKFRPVVTVPCFVHIFRQSHLKDKPLKGNDDTRIDDEVSRYREERSARAEDELKETAEVLEKARGKAANAHK